MVTIASTEAKTHFGALLDTAQRTPVIIEKKGRPIAESSGVLFEISSLFNTVNEFNAGDDIR